MFSELQRPLITVYHRCLAMRTAGYLISRHTSPCSDNDHQVVVTVVHTPEAHCEDTPETDCIACCREDTLFRLWRGGHTVVAMPGLTDRHSMSSTTQISSLTHRSPAFEDDIP